MERALADVSREYTEAGKARQFAVLKAWLTGDPSSLRPAGQGVATYSQGAAAAELGMSEGAVKVAIHRLRKRFREAVRREVAATVEDETAVGAELGYLVEALQS